jgi:hypothetical protein
VADPGSHPPKTARRISNSRRFRSNSHKFAQIRTNSCLKII